MESNILKQMLRGAAAVSLCAVVWTSTGLAQTTTAPVATPTAPSVPTTTPGGLVNPVPAGAAGEQEQSQVDRFLMNHQQVAQELHNNPSLINNPEWLAKHPEVNEWMKTHPSFAADAAKNPNWLVNHEEADARNDERHGVKETDAFMRNHPQVAGQLEKDPNLINNPEYLAKHPQLESYLKDHPEIAREWQAHPGAFTRAAERGAGANTTPKAHPVAAHPMAHPKR